MTIQILPARLANQIAAGEVVERPASVVKELVENSLDAGATHIVIDIEKGGAKRIKISDNGVGIVKDELTLALSRHATSKIKSLDDLEAIASLGFRGEALASISSVSRLTLTSKPKDQDAAWQASAQGRDMAVSVQPAAHPDGTSIDVEDLFFNTPARRKFLRTEKTEFNHIEEVVRRIALSEFNVSFVLNHNGKKVRHFKALNNKDDYQKRIAAVCGKAFVEQSVAIDCQHHDIHLWGWIAKPGYFRQQNDLCYSYVNGRMMRDKLINHAIRQAFAHQLPEHSYPAFVLYLELDHKEVDVNVHPAKHEVRFHQGRYVHDFILSVIEKAIAANSADLLEAEMDVAQQVREIAAPSYITPLAPVATMRSAHSASFASSAGSSKVNYNAATNYAQLMNTVPFPASSNTEINYANESVKLLTVINQQVALVESGEELKCFAVKKLAKRLMSALLIAQFHQGVISQPLLLPVSVILDELQLSFIGKHFTQLQQLGFQLALNKNQCQIRQCPAQFRNKDVANGFMQLIDMLLEISSKQVLADHHCCSALASIACEQAYDQVRTQALINQAKSEWKTDFTDNLDLISVPIDLTSSIKQALE